jgi:hypothetical protein
MSTTPIVVVAYWVFQYDRHQQLDYFNVTGHIVVGIFLIYDILISATPMRVHHFYQGATVGLFYIFFNLSYYLAGGRNPFTNDMPTLYPYLNWDQDIGIAFLKGLALVGLQTILWLFMFGVYLIRMFLYSKYADIDNEWTEIP